MAYVLSHTGRTGEAMGVRGQFLIEAHLLGRTSPSVKGHLSEENKVLLSLPVKDQSPRDQDILQVTDVVRGYAEVTEVVPLVVVRDLREVRERLQYTALNTSHYCSPRYM